MSGYDNGEEFGSVIQLKSRIVTYAGNSKPFLRVQRHYASGEENAEMVDCDGLEWLW